MSDALAWGEMESVLDRSDASDEKVVDQCTVVLLDAAGSQVDSETVTFHSREDVEGSELWEAAEDAVLARNGLTRDQVEITTPW